VVGTTKVGRATLAPFKLAPRIPGSVPAMQKDRFDGIPNLPDGLDFANPHGMAIKFHLPDGSADMVTNSLSSSWCPAALIP
jgi:hypothetical protein